MIAGDGRRACARRRGTPRRGAAVLALAIGAWHAGFGIAAAAGLPRVFFTPAERAALRAERMGGHRAVGAAADPEAPPAVRGAPEVVAGPAVAMPPGAPEPARPLRVEGVTLGRGAARAVWIGGERIRDGARWRGYRVQVTGEGARLVGADGSVRHVRIGMEVPR